jgi:hypothetical protein
MSPEAERVLREGYRHRPFDWAKELGVADLLDRARRESVIE